MNWVTLIFVEDDNDFEFVHYNRHSDYAHVELNEMEDE